MDNLLSLFCKDKRFTLFHNHVAINFDNKKQFIKHLSIFRKD